MRFELLAREHDRAGFDCGSAPLNQFLERTARQHIERGISRTFVLVEKQALPPKPITGFITLSASEVLKAELPEKHARRLPNQTGLVRLARLAVAHEHQGKGIGLVLIHEALRKTVEVAERIGVCGLIVDAKDEAAASFYEHFGFKRVETNPLALFLPLQTIREMTKG